MHVTEITQIEIDGQNLSVGFDAKLSDDLSASAYTVVDLKREGAVRSADANPVSPFVPLKAPIYSADGTHATLRPDLIDSSNPAGLLSNGWYEAAVRHDAVEDDGANVQGSRYLNADFDDSGSVNFNDFMVLQNNFNRTGKTFADGDADYNGTVNSNDYVILQNNFGFGLPALLTRPGDAAVSNATPRRLSVSWSASDTEPRDGFRIYRSSDGCDFELVDDAVDPAARVWEDPATDLVPGQKYWHRVRSFTTAQGVSASVAKASAVVTDPSAAPDDVSATGIEDGRIALSWSVPPGSSAGAFYVYRGTTPDFVPGTSSFVTAVTSGDTSYVDTGLTSGATYYYAVTAALHGRPGSTSFGPGGPQSAPSLTAGAPAADENGPAAPSLSVGKNADHDTWVDITYSTPDASHLELEIKKPGDENFAVSGMVLDSTPGDHQATVFAGTAGAHYAFRLRADRDAKIKYSPTVEYDVPRPLSLQKPVVLEAAYASTNTLKGNYVRFASNYVTQTVPNGGPGILIEQVSGDPYGVAYSAYKLLPTAQQNPNNLYADFSYAHTSPYGIKGTITASLWQGGDIIRQDKSDTYTVATPPIDYVPAAPVLSIDGTPDADGYYTIHFTTQSRGKFDAHDIVGMAFYRVTKGVPERIFEGSGPGVEGGDVRCKSTTDTQFFAYCFNSAGDQSLYSNIVTCADGDPPPTPQAPDHFQAATQFADAPCDKPSENKVNLVWDNVPNNETGYEIERSDDAGETYENVGHAPADKPAVTDIGMLPGSYLYRVRAVIGNGHSEWKTITVGVWPPGLMVGFDGTFQVESSGTNVSHMKQEYSNGSNSTLYQNGVGANEPDPDDRNVWQGAFATESMNVMAGMFRKVTEIYQDPSARKHVPLDVIGYSRGCFQAVLLANIAADQGVPDLSSAYMEAYKVWIPNSGGQTPPNGYHLETRTRLAYRHRFQVKVRSLTLVSPVGMNGVDSAITALSLGLIPNLNVGWDTTASGRIAHVFELRDNNPGHPIYNETPIGYDGDPSHFDTHTFDQVGEDYNHGEIGVWQNTWNWIRRRLRDVNVPIA